MIIRQDIHIWFQKICQLLDEKSIRCSKVWTREGILSAVKGLLKKPNTLFDDKPKSC